MIGIIKTKYTLKSQKHPKSQDDRLTDDIVFTSPQGIVDFDPCSSDIMHFKLSFGE